MDASNGLDSLSLANEVVPRVSALTLGQSRRSSCLGFKDSSIIYSFTMSKTIPGDRASLSPGETDLGLWV